jgi:L-lactate dehydrogenase (cytochrome)
MMPGMDLDRRYPALSDLRARARRRIPHFAWEYLDSATGEETVPDHNRAALDAVRFHPAILAGDREINLATRFLGRDYALPFGVAPVGMSGLYWPGAEVTLAQVARARGIPYALSTVAAQTPETLAPHIGDNGWFQLYTPRDAEILADILKRAKAAGFHTLIVTADVPAASRRERQVRGGVTSPPRITPRLLSHVATCPAWALGTLQQGMPRLRLMESYAKANAGTSSTAHVGYQLRANPDWDYLARLREAWDGPVIVKGVTDPAVAPRLAEAGVDAIWLSNHAGRQFDGAPPALPALPAIRAALPDMPLIYDGGIASGLDVVRALALGADFVMLGKAWHWGLGAFGKAGADHVAHILSEDMRAVMAQIGATAPDDLPAPIG